jgi:hypothetical protein
MSSIIPLKSCLFGLIAVLAFDMQTRKEALAFRNTVLPSCHDILVVPFHWAPLCQQISALFSLSANLFDSVTTWYILNLNLT